MNKYKAFLIHFLNIAGLGPIFGAIQGALFGPSAFLWIVLGTIFAGAVHDFFSGYLSVKLDGLSLPGLISEYLGEPIRKLLAILTIITLILLTATFTTGSATLIYSLTNIPILILLIIIFVYLLIASIFPIDKIIGKIYPIFGVLFLVMSILMIGGLLVSNTYVIPEFTTANLYFSKYPIFPFLFITIACGAVSGFHSSQSPIIARCVDNEKDMRFVFYGAMVLEGITALIWAAVTMAFFHGQPQIAALYGANPAIGVKEMSFALLGTLGLTLTIIGVVICPITSADTALRSARIIIGDELKINQSKLISRLKISIPIFIITLALTFVDFALIWRYFAFVQIIVASLVLWAATVYLMRKKKHYIITILPAMFCSLVAIAYILQAPEGLHLSALISNIIAIIGTAIITVAFINYYKKKKDIESIKALILSAKYSKEYVHFSITLLLNVMFSIFESEFDWKVMPAS